MNKHWYVLEAYPGFEHDVYLRLANATLDVWRPIDIVRPSCRRSSRPTTTAVRPRRLSRFGPYIFLHAIMTESLFHAVRNTTNVKRLVCYSGTSKPCIISDELIQFYRDSLPEKSDHKLTFSLGDKVMIENGPMKGISAVVKGLCGSKVLELEWKNSDHHSCRIVIESGFVTLI